MPTFNFTISGDINEDREDLKIYTQAIDMFLSLHDINDKLRSRIKYTDGLSDSELQFLQELRDLIRLPNE